LSPGIQVPGTQQHVDALKEVIATHQTTIAGLEADVTERAALIVELNTLALAWLAQLETNLVTPDPASIDAAVTDDALLAAITA
jgi:hypothetical protein